MSAFGRSRTRRWSPRAIRLTALGLLAGSVALLLATLDMGFTRDEGFYFHYGTAYQHWFTDLDEADQHDEVTEVFDRDAVEKTWRGNMEHPPLMKTAFGHSWSLLARKDRRITQLRTVPDDPGRVRLHVAAWRSDGFEEGAEVVVLAPLSPGQSPTDATRVLARGVVTERTRYKTVVEAELVGAAELVERCQVRAEPGSVPQALTPCQAREVRAWAIMSESTAMRLPAILASGLAIMLIFLFGVELFGALAGLFGAIAFLFVPRHFLHAHLACFDMPIVAATLFVLYAFWRARADRRWALVAGVAWGVALLTKHNAFFLPVPLLLYWLWCGRDHIAFRLRSLSLRLPPLPLSLLVMPVVALPMLFAFWPKLWYDPLTSLRAYFAFHLEHDHYMQWYFGEPLQVPPFPVDLPFALTATTVPETFLFLALVGALLVAPPRRWGRWLRGVARRRPVSEREHVAVFVGLNALLPIVLIALPSTPIFGGVKHWMTGMPFIMLLAGFGLAQALRAIRAPRLVAATAAVLVIAQPAWASVRSAPFGTGYYNSLLAGGIQGAADKQMMRLYWGHTTRQAFDWLNANAKARARVFFQNTTPDNFGMYQRDGVLRHDIRYASSPAGSEIALIEPQKAFAELDLDVRQNYGVAGPTYQVTFEGVPMLKVYVRPDPSQPPVQQRARRQGRGSGQGAAPALRAPGVSGSPASRGLGGPQATSPARQPEPSAGENRGRQPR